ncbi:MAG: ATP-dependent DNA helicase [Nocardioides sp.]|nr:ATP-dependent DNA helicase [Nocardioides sp.]
MTRPPTRPPPREVRHRLVVPPVTAGPAPVLDDHQRAVVDHRGGPLLVLAGPGTGKTTTLVEAVVDRVERRGVDPASVLVLTFSRKAAEELRDRITARLGRTLSAPMAATFHSFAYGLVRRWSDPELYAAPPRLLSAPEQDVVVRELLAKVEESVRWPDALREARGTRGFAREVAAVLARAQEKGLGAAGLRALAAEAGRPDLAAAADFLDQYDTVLEAQNLLDYPGIIAQAVQLTGDPTSGVREQLRAQFSCVFVDEYQDTDPAQVALLRALAGDGRDLVAVGDPDQSIYAFRGAEVRGILDFPVQFPARDGSNAPVVALRSTRRFGARLALATRRIAAGIGVRGAIDPATFAAFREPTPLPGPYGDGRVEVHTFDTARGESEHLADLLRRAHLEDEVPWGEMAVLVRSGRSTLPGLRRSLAAAGVPVEVAADDTPLVHDPAVLPLLDALRVVVHGLREDPEHRDHVGADRATALLLSPLVGLDATDLRALARGLRARDVVAADEAGRPPYSSAQLLRRAVVEPGACDGIEGRAAARVRAFGELVARARALLADNGSAEQVLWELWDGTGWPQRLRAGVAAGGASARHAHRDLDALCAFFEVAARGEEEGGHTSPETFLATLAAQEFPADTLAERGVRGDAVRLLTAHRSKGLEWRLVVVAHVQEEGWPDLRRRTSLLAADRLSRDGLLPPTGVRTLLAEERRLFYVACTRARQRLIVTAVASPDDDGEQPSRFLAELGVEIHRTVGRPRRPLSLAGLVAELRRTAADPATAPGLREAAVLRLAQLADADVGGRPLAPAADPGSWWGTRARTHAEVPVRPEDAPVSLSASALDQLLTCPAQWFLEREAGGATASSQSQGFGNVVHAIADQVARQELETSAGADGAAAPVRSAEDLMAHVDQVWGRIAFRTPWSGGRERAEVQQALQRFLDWHHTTGAQRRLLATEQRLVAEVTLPDGQQVALRGFADRLEMDAEGRVVVVDLKTTKYPPTAEAVRTHPQLGLYQLAVEQGAAEAIAPGAQPGTAELVQLRKDTKGAAKVQALAPQEPDEDGLRPIERQLTEAVGRVRDEDFPARAGEHCKHCAFVRMCPTQGAGTVLS